MKKLSSFLLIGALTVSSSALAFANEPIKQPLTDPMKPISQPVSNGYHITANGNEVDLNGYNTYMEQNFIMIPIRPVAEAFGYKVDFNSENQSVVLKKGNDTFEVVLNKDQYIKNGEDAVSLGMSSALKNGSAYAPLQFFEQVLNMNIKFGNGYIFMAQVPEQSLNIQGKIESINSKDGINQLLVVSDKDQNQKMILNITDNTKLKNPITNEDIKLEDLKVGDRVSADYSPAMTKSLPAISNASSIEVINKASVTKGSIDSINAQNNQITINTKENVTDEKEKMNSQIVLNLSDETQIVDSNNNKVDVKDLKDGMKVKVYHSQAMTLSIPAQTSAIKIVIE